MKAAINYVSKFCTRKVFIFVVTGIVILSTGSGGLEFEDVRIVIELT